MYRKHGRNGIRRLGFGTDFERKSAQVLLVLTSFCVIALANAMSNTRMTSKYTPYGTARSVDLHHIGYQWQWHNALRAQAKVAQEDGEPYLANRLLQTLAEEGDRDAAFRLGLYFDSDDQDHDARLAVYWYQHAADAGEIHAQHNLAVAYIKGEGVPMDIDQAIKWWTLAARHGNADSQYNLGILYAAGEYGIKPDIERAKHWWRKAALHGDPMAQYNLGTLYVDNGANDYCEATRWWQEAARNGIKRARTALRIIQSRQDYHGCR